MAKIEQLRFLKSSQAKKIAKKFGTPVYIYSEKVLLEQAKQALNFPAPYGLTVRYAMKANSNSAILRIFNSLGLHLDASSANEAKKAIQIGFDPSKILMTAQEIPENLRELVEKGILFNAGSLTQLAAYGKAFPNSEVSIRINTGLGKAGMNNRLSTGGPAASFGIWHEYIPQIQELAKKYKLKIVRVHNHVGTGGNPELWQNVAIVGLNPIRQLPDVEVFDMGGGFSVTYMTDSKAANLQHIGLAVSEELEKFAIKEGRKIRLEIEPGRFLVAGAGTLISKIIDIVDTGKGGNEFLKLDTGMTEILRPAMYGAQHPIVVINSNSKHKKYIVVGHCCETSDTLTPEIDDPEAIEPRLLRQAQIGDLVSVEVAGAYCATMSAVNYHLFPQAAEVMLKTDGSIKLTRRRQTFEEILATENV